MNETMKKGCLYGISVGPGDASLMTLQAVEYMKKSDILLLPAANVESCLAYRIAVGACEEIRRKPYRCYDFPMTRDAGILEQSRDQIYEDIRGLLEKGLNAGFLVLGDWSVYSTYSYMESKARRDGFLTRNASGVTSFCAAAGRLGFPLVSEEEELHIIPGSGKVEEALKLPGTKVFMKLGKSLGRLICLLKDAEKEGKIKAYAVVNCGLADEQIYENLQDIPEQSGYLVTVIVKEKG